MRKREKPVGLGKPLESEGCPLRTAYINRGIKDAGTESATHQTMGRLPKHLTHWLSPASTLGNGRDQMHP